jgi:hypothetical protein
VFVKAKLLRIAKLILKKQSFFRKNSKAFVKVVLSDIRSDTKNYHFWYKRFTVLE